MSTSSDDLSDGSYLRIEFDELNLQKGDVGSVEINSLSADYFLLLEEMGDQIDNLGIFANPPANVRTNVKNVKQTVAQSGSGVLRGLRRAQG